jgi:Predicted pPIWI-associating nuclease
MISNPFANPAATLVLPLASPRVEDLDLQSGLCEGVERYLVSDFEHKLFAATLRNLDDIQNPLRFNNFAYATRELIRIVFRRLAPDAHVLECSWYKNETDKEKGITRRQRAYYAVQGGLATNYIQQSLALDIHVIYQPLKEAIDALSKFTHIDVESFPLTISEGTRKANETLATVLMFFDVIDQCRNTLCEALATHVDYVIVDAALSETILEIDELATHHYINDVYSESVSVISIGHDRIHFAVEGVVECELQWGSNSDAKNGDAAVLPESFPLHCELWSPVCDPEDLSWVEGSLKIDTASWQDRDGDEME